MACNKSLREQEKELLLYEFNIIFSRIFDVLDQVATKFISRQLPVRLDRNGGSSSSSS